ncbi:tRNA adenosine(34) deaminase TadA [Alteromonadaceae bacterium BrNp21-10]|nr:tRNA adenosine(34) deaminase TadA [Alteromonadaceae bacterium BrNp21-10]
MSQQSHIEHQHWMSVAFALAQKAADEGEIPVGAIVVKDNQIIGQGWNQSIQLHDPSAHAEMNAIRQAGQYLQNYRLPGATLYVTLEPCSMCAGMLVHSRIEHLVYGAADAKTGSAGSIMNLLNHEQLNHKVEVTSGVMAEQCSAMLSAFFRQRRQQKKQQRQNSQADT